jgi:hypothetical protein
MTASVLHLPTSAPAAAAPGLNLSPEEVQDAAGGYLRPADQLRELHARGFTRAYIPKVGRKRVILERAHYDAVVRGQYGPPATARPAEDPTPPAGPDMAGLKAFFDRKRRR